MGRIQVINKARAMDATHIAELAEVISEQPANDVTPQILVNNCLQRAKTTLSFVHTHPAIALAIFQNGSEELDDFTRQILTLALFGKLLSYNDHFLQHIIAAHILTYFLRGQNKRDMANQRKQMIGFISQNHLQLWQQIVSLQKVLFTPQSIKYVNTVKVTPMQYVSLLASVFSCCRNKHSASTLLAFVSQNAPTIYRDLLHSLATLVNTSLPGAQVYYKAHPATLIDIQRDYALVYSPTTDESEQFQWVKRSECFAPEPMYVGFEVFLSRYSQCESEQQIKGGHPFFPTAFAIQRPPAALLSIIDELQKPDVDITNLCRKVEATPTFRQFLLSTASQDNRLRLPVSNIKQAILTYGLERVGDMLVQFALIERLTQHQYPLLGISKQFTVVVCAIAAQLASITSTKFSPQSAALVSTFLCAPLFTLPGLKVATRLPVNHQGYFQVQHTFKVKSASPWHAIAGELADNWHQGATWRSLIRQAGKRHGEVPGSLQKEHAILQLAFGLAREHLFPLTQRNSATENTRNTLLHSIELTPGDVDLLIGRLGEYLYCPLSLHS